MLEFLGLKDEYSESEIEEALILHLERFLLELGGDFAFVGRQRRLRIGDEWYRIDLLFFIASCVAWSSSISSAVKFTHADAGQMHMYLNYAREHWTHEGENPPVGLILCSQKDEAIARYALDGLPNKILATEYRTVLPNERLIAEEIEKTGSNWKRDENQDSHDFSRKMRPRTTCLYSAASMLLRSLSAASQSLASKPMLAELLFDDLCDLAPDHLSALILAKLFLMRSGNSVAGARV